MAIAAPSFNGYAPASPASSRCKQSNGARDTAHELKLRRELWRSGLRFRTHSRHLPGKPDIVFPAAKLVVFCDGDFWHGKDWRRLQKKLKRGSNHPYWLAKISSNIKRDRRHTQNLKKDGWNVLRLWESEIKEDLFAAAGRVRQAVKIAGQRRNGDGLNLSAAKKSLTFIDLFAGLGGFHLALARLGHRCLFASEINSNLRDLYSRNFGLTPAGDIWDMRVDDIPKHDILCAGFPCQPFSKAGSQRGLDCPQWGDLFERVLAILRRHKPNYIILENVPNLERHNKGKTWKRMQMQLHRAGYHVQHRRLSPHRFGIPQIRERLFIVGSRTSLTNFSWPHETSGKTLSILSALDKRPHAARSLSVQSRNCLNIWQDFLNKFPKTSSLPSFPIWSMEFGATYPFEATTPHALGIDKLRKYKGSHGVDLSSVPSETLMPHLPSHARPKIKRFPKWKIDFIRQNREFYRLHKEMIDAWLPQILDFPSSLQKFEWNCKGAERNLWKLVIQFRASGVRVKRPTTAPSLIAMTSTQVPIIGWEKRYMIPRECARLQSMHELPHLPESSNAAFKALGNAVNVDLLELIATSLTS